MNKFGTIRRGCSRIILKRTAKFVSLDEYEQVGRPGRVRVLPALLHRQLNREAQRVGEILQ
jgi:hypothetical protein